MKGLFFCLLLLPLAVMAQPNGNMNLNNRVQQVLHVSSQQTKVNTSNHLNQNPVSLALIQSQQRNITIVPARNVPSQVQVSNVQRGSGNTVRTRSVQQTINPVNVTPNSKSDRYASVQNQQEQRSNVELNPPVLNDVGENNVPSVNEEQNILQEEILNTNAKNERTETLVQKEEKVNSGEKEKMNFSAAEIELTVVRFNPKAKEGKELTGIKQSRTEVKRVKRKKGSFYSQHKGTTRFAKQKKNRSARREEIKMIPCFSF